MVKRSSLSKLSLLPDSESPNKHVLVYQKLGDPRKSVGHKKLPESVKNATSTARESPFVRHSELGDIPTLSSAVKKRFNLRSLKNVPDVGGPKEEFKTRTSPS